MTGIGLAFLVVALALLVSSLMLLLMRMDNSGPGLADEEQGNPSILSSIGVGIQYARSDRAMLAIFLLIMQMELLMRGPVTVGIPVLAHTRLTEGVLALGVVTSAYAAGSVLGTVLAGSLPAPKRGLGPILVAVFALSGILMMPFGWLNATWLAAAITLTIGVMGGYVGILIISWIQGRTPQAMLGRSDEPIVGCAGYRVADFNSGFGCPDQAEFGMGLHRRGRFDGGVQHNNRLAA